MVLTQEDAIQQVLLAAGSKVIIALQTNIYVAEMFRKTLTGGFSF